MGSGRVRSTVTVVATHCGGDHSSHTRDCLSRPDCGLLRKITRRLWHTRTGHAAFSEFLALARRMDTLLGFRLISGRVAGTAGSASWDFPLSTCSLLASHISISPHPSTCLLCHSICGNETIGSSY